MKRLTLADFLHMQTNSKHSAAPMWCIKSTVVVVNFILDRLKEIRFYSIYSVISTSSDSDITKHLWQNPDHHIDFNNPIVLSYASSWGKLFKKSLLIP